MFQKDKHLILDEGLEPTVAVNMFAANADELLCIQATDIDEGSVTLKFLEPGDPDDTHDETLLASAKTVAGAKAAIKDLCDLIALRRGTQVMVAGKDVKHDNVVGYPITAHDIAEVTTLTLAADGADITIPWTTAPSAGYYYEAKLIEFDTTDDEFVEGTFVVKSGHITSDIATNGIDFDADDVLEVFSVGDVFAVRVKIFSDSNPTGVTDENTGATENAGYTFV